MRETRRVTLACGGVPGEEAGDVGIFHGTRVDDHAIAVAQAFARLEGHGAVLRFVVGEGGEAPWIGGEEAVGAGVPTHRVAGIRRVIEDGDAQLFARDLAGIIAPVGRLAPDLLFAHQPFRVGDVRDALILLQQGAQADAEGAVLAIAEGNRDERGERDVQVEIAQLGIGIEGHHPGFGEEGVVAFHVGPFEGGGDGALSLAALELAVLREIDAAQVLAVQVGEVAPLVVPEVELIDVVVGEPEAALVRVIHGRGTVALRLLFGGFLGDVLHGPGASDVGSGGGAQGPQVRFGHLGAEGLAGHVEIGERLAVDLDEDFAGGGGDLHLRGGRQGGQGGGGTGQKWRVHRNYFSAHGLFPRVPSAPHSGIMERTTMSHKLQLGNAQVDETDLADLCRRYRVGELSLFGSAARGEMRADSDIDMLVEFLPDAGIDLVDYAGLMLDLSRLLGSKVDLVSKNGLKPLIRASVLEEARLLYTA